MASFVCPRCSADVTKNPGDGLGCPCCGYGVDGAFVSPPIKWPVIPDVTSPVFPADPTPWIVPQSPWPGTYPWGDLTWPVIITTTSANIPPEALRYGGASSSIEVRAEA